MNPSSSSKNYSGRAFHASGEDFVREQSLRHAVSHVRHAASANAEVQQAATQIICQHLEKRLQNNTSAEETEEAGLRKQLTTCCLTTAILTAVYEHNVRTDPKAKWNVGRRELALRSLPPQARPDGSLTGNLKHSFHFTSLIAKPTYSTYHSISSWRI